MPASTPDRIAVEFELPCSTLYFSSGAAAPITHALGAPRLSPKGAGLVPGEIMSSLPMGIALTMRRKVYAAGYPAVGSPLLGTLATTIAARGDPGRSATSAKARSSSGVVAYQWLLKLRIRAPIFVAYSN